jgi:3-oxoacyl-[acyl-carrier protein] reductase
VTYHREPQRLLSLDDARWPQCHIRYLVRYVTSGEIVKGCLPVIEMGALDMDLGLKDRIALVCASTKGLGRATAEALAAEGSKVVVTGRHPESTELASQEIPGSWGSAADLTDARSVTELGERVVSRFGQIDVLVLNGPGPTPGTAASLTPSAISAAVESLLLTQVALVNAALPGMRERGWGRIVAIGSSGVVSPLANLAASNIGRAALAGYLKTLASEVAGDGITVNMVLPGRISTDRVASLDEAAAARQNISATEARRRSETTIPVGRYGRPSEFGATVAFLCGTGASYITGSQVRCDGGMLSSY